MKFNEPECLDRNGFCKRNCDNASLINTVEQLKPPYFSELANEEFFKCFCKETCTARRRLDMRGPTIHEKIKRLFEDTDVPALIIFLRKYQDIVYINLGSNNITDSGFKNLIDHALTYKQIEELDLQNNNITELGTRYLLEVGHDLKIKSLNLKTNKLGASASIHVANLLLKNMHLIWLNVAEIDQTASSLIYFIAVLSQDQDICNVTLKHLDISRPNPGCMHYFDSVHFASVIGHMLKRNTTLSALHLQKYNFSCHDIETMMSNAIHNNTLLLLNLGCNNIGDHGVDHLAKWLTKRPQLRILVLCSNIITDHGARSLSFTLPFSRLLSLDISYNKITDVGMVELLYTLKKSPLLRQLRIFGNAIGHPVGKIIERMLISKVLNQENIDIRPYRVDHRWYIARFEGDRCKKKYQDVPYELFSRESLPPIKKTRLKRTYYKYIYNRIDDINVQHSVVRIMSSVLITDHRKDCRCCYCFKCKAPHYDDGCRDLEHPDTCTCCKCKGDDESSDWSVDKEILNRVKTPPDPVEKVAHILKRVGSETAKNIARWINIDEDVLEEDLKAIASGSDTDKDSCNCSWAQLSISSLQKYLEETSSKNLLIIPKSNTTMLKDIYKGSDNESCVAESSASSS
ncbi:uncharacterized protein LOC117227102 isoform X2 [Megalopta genalis]|uniref:uncharacterized protein LOC117227102 isoform X2 n=1 Tax=Megalopta genalis TaxID=115081 RepID=UPI003FD672F8